MGKRPRVKLKSVTIMHKQTTDAVRLPEGRDGVIIHQGIRSKVPLKKRVRDGRIKRKRKTGKNKEKQPKNSKTSNNPLKKDTVVETAKENKTVTVISSPVSSDQKKKRISAAIGSRESEKKKDATHNKYVIHLNLVLAFFICNFAAK